MAQTTLHRPVDVVDLLAAQHDRIKTLFDETLRAAGVERDNRELRDNVREHAGREEHDELQRAVKFAEAIAPTPSRDAILGYGA